MERIISFVERWKVPLNSALYASFNGISIFQHLLFVYYMYYCHTRICASLREKTLSCVFLLMIFYFEQLALKNVFGKVCMCVFFPNFNSWYCAKSKMATIFKRNFFKVDDTPNGRSPRKD